MDADDVEVVFFFADETIYEFSGAKDVVDEDVVEHLYVGAPLLEIIHYKEREDIACVCNKGTVDLHAPKDFPSAQVARVQCEDGYVVSNVDEFFGYILCVRSQSAYKLWRVFPDEKAYPQLTHLELN